MNVPFFSLQRQYLEIKDEIEDAISDVLSSGSYILGENVLKFECEFANYCGAKYAVGVASGSDALVLALNGLNANGSDVLTVSHTFISTADAIIKNNANLRFVDIDRSDFNMNVSLLPKAITDSTRGILPVHMYGHPVEMDAIKEIAAIATELNDKMENIGARRLHTVMTSLLEDILFQLPDNKIKKVKLDKKLVREKLSSISEDEDLRRYIL